MTWRVGFQFETGPAIDMLNAVEGELKRWPADDLMEIASLAMFRIKRRTKRGEDMFGSPFTPYSEEWAQVREETGRQTDHVDLLYNGHMFAAMTPRAGAGRAIVGWTSRFEALKAMAHHRGRGVPERPWFGIAEGSDDWEILRREAATLTAQRIEDLGRFS